MEELGDALLVVGRVVSDLADRDDAPKQPHEGAPPAWLAFDAAVADALHGVEVGDEVVVLTWLHQSVRDVLAVHPRGRTENAPTGVFDTRSPDRPNPIGLHRVTVTEVDPEGARLRVDHLEAIDGTPVLDVKPARGC